MTAGVAAGAAGNAGGVTARERDARRRRRRSGASASAISCSVERPLVLAELVLEVEVGTGVRIAYVVSHTWTPYHDGRVFSATGHCVGQHD